MRLESFIEELRGRLGRAPRIALYGLGVSNTAILGMLSQTGLTELTLRSDSSEANRGFNRIFCGEDVGRDIREDVWILSPSVRRDSPAVSEARRRGVYITSDCEIFFKGRGHDCIAVSGSDGKSTTVSMCSAILEKSGITAPAIGNIGVPYCSAPSAQLYVTELSSFNLNYLTPPTLRAAITNITENHLNWHRDFAEYRAAKANLLRDTEGAVLCADDPECAALAKGCTPFAVFSAIASGTELMHSFTARHYLWVCDDEIILDGEPYLPKTAATATSHGKLNAMAALGLTLGIVSRSDALEALHSFRSLDHRSTTCGFVRGVEYIDSSIDTTPLRTLTTLRGLNRRVHLLLGGKGKGLDLSPLADAVAEYGLRVAVYGECGPDIFALLRSDTRLARIEIALFKEFDEAFAFLSDSARYSDTVVLSPGATAYGEFKNYRHRGERFQKLVNALKYNPCNSRANPVIPMGNQEQ